MTAVWLVAMIVLLIIEGIVPGLVSIWFAIGAFAAMISAILGAPLWLQVLWFFAVSILTLCLTRPFAKKYVNSRAMPTNADMQPKDGKPAYYVCTGGSCALPVDMG